MLCTLQAAIGVVGNPALCPAFRVRRGSGREYGLMTGRARRATARLRANFGTRLGTVPTSAASERAGAALAARLALRAPASLPLRWSSLGTRSESGGGTDGIEGSGRGPQSTPESSTDARDPMTWILSGTERQAAGRSSKRATRDLKP